MLDTTMKGRSCFFAAVFAAIVCMALPSFAADWTDASGNEYTALKYIRGTATGSNTGGGWIVTEIQPVSNDVVKMRFKLTETRTQSLWCSRGKATTTATFTGFYINSIIRCDRNGSTSASGQTSPSTSGDDCAVVADYGTCKFRVNGTIQDATMAGGSYTPGSKLMLFASHIKGSTLSASIAANDVSNRGSYYLYYFQLCSSTGELKHNLMPAKNMTSNVVGLYDTVTSNFYAKATNSGDFIAAEWGSDRAGKKWTGAGDGVSMSDDDNWEGGAAPVAGDDIDFTIAVPNAAIDADIDATFGKVYLGTGDIPAFIGSLTATAVNDLTRMQAYDTATANFIFTLAAPTGQDFTWNGAAAANWWATDIWTYNSAASSWYDNNTAVFNTANATATLNANVTAESVVFGEDATIVTNGTDAATLTVPTVSVAQNVSATIAAPTSGALEKTGAGTLTLTESRTDATTVTAGTLKMDGATVSTLTLGTNGGAPVVFDYGGQPKAGNVNSYLVKGSCVTLTNGTFTMSNLNDGTALPSVLTIAKDATLQSTSGTALFDAAGEATVNIAGGTWRKSSNNKTTIQDYSANGRLNINVTDGGTFASQQDVYCMVYEGTEVTETPSLYMKLVESTLAARNFYFPNVSQPANKLPVRPTGVLAATNSTITVATTFAIGRNTQDAKTAGSFTADFENCVVTTQWFIVNHDRPLNNARFNNTRFVFRTDGAIEARTGEDKWITVGDDGLTLDTQAYACSLNANLGGSGAVTKIGTGMLTVTSNQTSTAAFNVNEGTNAVNGGVSISRPMTIASGATLKVDATDTASISSLTLAAGSTLNIASYVGKTPLALTLLTLPAEGTVNLTLNGDAFPQGVYSICSAPDVTAAEGDKFTFTTTDELVGNWSVDDGTLILTVGEIPGNYWTGRGGDGKMSTGANWGSGEVPAAGSDIDLSGITAATTIIADANRTFGAVMMGTGVITFTNAMAATSFTDTAKIAVAADSTVTLDGDLVFADSTTTKYIVYTVAEGGVFRVTGRIELTGFTGGGYLGGSVANTCPGTIAAKGLFNDCTKDTHNYPRFVLGRGVNNYQGTWAIGSDGLDGSGGFQVAESCASAKIVAEADFVDSANICNRRSLVIDAAGHEVALGTNTLAGSGGIYGGGNTTIVGRRVVANYDVGNMTTWAASLNNPFTVNSGATLALAHGTDLGNGVVAVQDGGTLEVAESGTVTLKGDLSLADGAVLGFNFTERRNDPVLALASGKSVVFTEGASTNIVVKVSGDVWPTGGEKVLTTCGGFNAEIVSLAAGAPKWASGLTVNGDGNIVLSVKPKAMVIVVR